MSRGPSKFKQSQVTKAVKGVQAAGCEVERVKIDAQGCITVEMSRGATQSGESEKNEWDEAR